jgi:hypothetical protein
VYPDSKTIYLGTELIYPPRKHEKTLLQQFYTALSTEAKFCGCDYDKFTYAGESRLDLRTGQGETLSQCLVMSDRIRLSEGTTASLEDFVTRIKEVAAIAGRVLNTGIYIIQSCNVQRLFRPSTSKDSRVFLAEKVCKMNGKENISPYFEDKRAHVFGVRLAFPPTPDQEQAGFAVRIESDRRDIGWIWAENIGTYIAAPIKLDNLEPLGANMQRTAAFLTKNVFEFLSQFDK